MYTNYTIKFIYVCLNMCICIYVYICIYSQEIVPILAAEAFRISNAHSFDDLERIDERYICVYVDICM
jgi:hypothetical protein